ncbi:MAG: DUF2752 domain-containing protein [Candidatus Nealsonbacteria bacterium]|nr:DUF2752 domain-containing protein [Candidatus Nealsonbacteria bacterium]
MSLSVRDRATSAAVAAGLLFSLGLAVWLQPAPERMGTHQQLGLPRCTFRVLFGMPCPTCGMTTSWAHMVRGQVPSALRANVGGTLLAVVAVAAVPWLLISAIRGRWVGWAPNSIVAAWVAAVIVLIVLVDWSIRLATG